MADINVERKGPSIWPWVIGLVILALVIWAIAELMGDGEVVETEPAGVEAPMVVPPPAPDPNESALGAEVEAYLAACASTTAPVALDHQYTSNCLDQLSAALEAVVENPEMADVNLQAQIEDFRTKADRLVESPDASTEHSNMTREAFLSAATLLDDLQDERFPNLEAAIDQLEEAANAVEADAPLTEQGDAVHTFFRQAGDLLRGMGTPATM